MTYNLSKSRYCSGVQCPKMLWLKKNMPEEFDNSVINDAVMATGEGWKWPGHGCSVRGDRHGHP